MADGDWTKAELADSDNEEEKDVVITESDQFVFPAVIRFPRNHKKLSRAAVSFETAARFSHGRRGSDDHFECL